MATSKSGSKASTAKSSTKKTASSASTKKVTQEAVVATKPKFAVKRPSFKKPTGEANYPAIILAELVGTFVLTLVALLTLQDTGALYVGLTVAVLILGVGAVSGAHLNPAVTFGLWSARKLNTVLVPVYWISQFAGAAVAILTLGLFGNGYSLDFTHFGALHWGILGAEALGTAVFLFGLVAAATNDKLSQVGKAFGIGLALTVGILVSSAGLTALQNNSYNEYSAKQQATAQQTQNKEEQSLPAELYVKGATLNPAVALASTEYTENQVNRLPAGKDEAQHSRLGLETILGTLIGAAIGANLYLFIAYVNRQQNA